MCLAIPGKVLEVVGAEAVFLRGQVDFAGVRRDVSFAFTPEVRAGDYVLVHAGCALTIVDEREAETTLADLHRLGVIMDELDESADGAPAQ